MSGTGIPGYSEGLVHASKSQRLSRLLGKRAGYPTRCVGLCGTENSKSRPFRRKELGSSPSQADPQAATTNQWGSEVAYKSHWGARGTLATVTWDFCCKADPLDTRQEQG